MDTKDDDTFQKNENIYKNDISFEKVENPKEPIEQIEVRDESAKKATTQKKLKKVKKPIKPKAKKTKKAPAKAPARRKKPKKRKSSSGWPYVVLVIIILVAVGIAIYANLNLLAGDDTDTTGEGGDTEVREGIAATVNGITITNAELDKKYASLPELVQQTYARADLLDQLINETLLIQRAKERGFTATDAEAEAQLEELLAQNGITREQFAQSIQQQGLTIEDFLEVQKNRLLISQLFDETIFNNVEVTDEEIQDYYEENIDSFQTDAQVRVRHILIGITPDREAEAAEELANDLVADLEEGADFCDLVTEYSEDPGSLDTCGEYTFGEGVMVAPFEEASFDMDVDEIRAVESQFGYHVIEKLEDIEAGTVPLEDARDQIEEAITATKGDELFNDLMTDLREEADIVYGDEAMEDVTGGAVIDDAETIIEIEPDEIAEEAEEDVEEVVEETEEAAEETVEEVEETAGGIQEELTDMAAEDVAACLGDKGAIVYGTFWSKGTKDQKDILGDSFEDLTYVECDPNGLDADPDACEEEGVDIYPTWVVGTDTAAGVQELADLASLAGC